MDCCTEYPSPAGTPAIRTLCQLSWASVTSSQQFTDTIPHRKRKVVSLCDPADGATPPVCKRQRIAPPDTPPVLLAMDLEGTLLSSPLPPPASLPSVHTPTATPPASPSSSAPCVLSHHSPRSPLQLFIFTPEGRTLTLTTSVFDTVHSLKQQIQVRLPYLSPGMFWLVYGVKPLDPARTIADYNIADNATIHMHIRNIEVLHEQEFGRDWESY